MLRISRQGKSPLLVLLFAVIMGSHGCVTGSRSQVNQDQMEASQNEDVEDDDVGDDSDVASEDLQDDSNAANATDEADDDGDISDDETADDSDSLSDDETADLGEKPAETPVAVHEDVQDTGYIAGKSGRAMEEGLPEEGSKMAYIVQKGDTLSKIAKRIFFNQEKWRELARTSTIRNPNRIYPGDVIFYQLDKTTVAFAKKYEGMKRDVTTVREGESLSEVSKRIYGDQDQWKFLWRQNDQINDPSNLVAGSFVYFVSPQVLNSLSSEFTSLKLQKKAQWSDVTKVWKHKKYMRS